MATGRQQTVQSGPDVDIDDGGRRIRGGRKLGARGRRLFGLVLGDGFVSLQLCEERDSLAAGDGEELSLRDTGLAHHADGFAVADDGGACSLGQAVGTGEAIYVQVSGWMLVSVFFCGFFSLFFEV